MANFDYLKSIKQYAIFAESAMEAERVYNTSYSMCAIGCRKALEMAVKWIYKVERDLVTPYNNNLSSLIHNPDFHDLLEEKTWKKLPYIVRLGNFSVHTTQSIKAGEALASLRALFEFIQWIDYCYGEDYAERTFDENAIPKAQVALDAERIRKQQSLLAEQQDKLTNMEQQLQAMQAELAKQKQLNAELHQSKNQNFNAEDISEYETRKRYIDLDLRIQGWSIPAFIGDGSGDVSEEFPVDDMGGIQGQQGFVDYVLWGRDGLPLAVVEAKRTSKDPNVGKNQAQLYAEALNRKYNRMPCIFYTNGFTTYFWDIQTAPPRIVSSVFSKSDLERIINRRELCKDPGLQVIDENITGRDYQIKAIRAMCDAFREKRRKFLFVMATGSGKTRTAASAVDVLARSNNITNVLFLADRTALVKQARDAFHEYLPDMSLCNLCTNKQDYNARIVFSTYPTILNAIDDVRDNDKQRIFTPAHFDLIIIDEAHRSIFKKYRAIFQYFDAMLLGLTATPKTDVDHNTYEFFELEDNIPTAGYEYDEAIRDGYLVPYKNFEVQTKFLHEGIRYDELSEADKKRYEEAFAGDDGEIPDYIPSNKLNKHIFNLDTIDTVLNNLMEWGIKVKGGDRLGKTIIFAQNKEHARIIVERFDKLFPRYKGTFARRVVCDDAYAQDLIDKFKVSDSDPVIAVSVDMLDTGVDVPECVNLVFFKEVFSKTKFWQMIGRGTRLCKNLNCVDRETYADKKHFYIFDYCGNFEFFRTNVNGIEGSAQMSLTESIFRKQIALIEALQAPAFAEQKYQDLRQSMVEFCNEQINQLNMENSRVRLEREYVERYKPIARFQSLSKSDVADLCEHLGTLVYNPDEDEYAKNFDNLMYGLMLAHITQGKTIGRSKSKLIKTGDLLLHKTNIPQIKDKEPAIKLVGTDAYWDANDITLFEQTRKDLRGLMKFIERKYYPDVIVDLTDPTEGITEGDPLDSSNDFADYRKRVNKYIEENPDNLAIFKLTHNTPLTESELKDLQLIFLHDLGTEEDYKKEFKETALGITIRKLATMDREAVKGAFASFANKYQLNSYQMEFVERLINYIRDNGYISELGQLMKPPFSTGIPFMKAFDQQQRKDLVTIIKSFEINATQALA